MNKPGKNDAQYISVDTTGGEDGVLSPQMDEIVSKMNFGHIDKLLGTSGARNQETCLQTYPHDDHIPHATELKFPNNVFYQIGYMIDNFLFGELRAMEFTRWCPTCLSYKAPKTKHCKSCKMCVPLSNHHSTFFDSCISLHRNHLQYYLLLVQQTILLGYFIVLMMSYYWDQRMGSIFYIIPETFVLMVGRYEIFSSFMFLVALILFSYSAFYTFIESYGISQFLTFQEMTNLNRYHYLFKMMKERKNVFKSYFHMEDQGPISNLKAYLGFYIR